MSASKTATTRARFLLSRSSSTVEADIGPATTGREALEGLIEGGHLDKATDLMSYTLTLARTNKQLPLSQSLVGEGVKDGDSIAVNVAGVAGRP